MLTYHVFFPPVTISALKRIATTLEALGMQNVTCGGNYVQFESSHAREHVRDDVIHACGGLRHYLN